MVKQNVAVRHNEEMSVASGTANRAHMHEKGISVDVFMKVMQI